MLNPVLIVDDEPSIVTLLQYHIEKEGYPTVVCHDGIKAMDVILSQKFSFILLDIMLPGMDGVEILRTLRTNKNDTPVLLITAKDDVVDKIVGLEIGADDYITKPFSPREVIARMKVIARRVEKKELLEKDQPEEKLQVGTIQVYPEDYRVTKNGQEISLTKKEFLLLLYLMKRKNRIIDRDRLLEQLWPEDIYGQSRTVDVHISHLREKIEDDPKNPVYLKTIRGFGYQFVELQHES